MRSSKRATRIVWLLATALSLAVQGMGLNEALNVALYNHVYGNHYIRRPVLVGEPADIPIVEKKKSTNACIKKMDPSAKMKWSEIQFPEEAAATTHFYNKPLSLQDPEDSGVQFTKRAFGALGYLELLQGCSLLFLGRRVVPRALTPGRGAPAASAMAGSAFLALSELDDPRMLRAGAAALGLVTLAVALFLSRLEGWAGAGAMAAAHAAAAAVCAATHRQLGVALAGPPPRAYPESALWGGEGSLG